jgi:hypothetical protein
VNTHTPKLFLNSESQTQETAKTANETPTPPKRVCSDAEKPPGWKLPAFQFYPGDWRKAPDVQSLTLAARGLWIEMICMMHESAPRGYLELNGRPVSDSQLARMTGSTVEEITLLLSELEGSGVFSRDARGVIYCRRVSRDEYIRQIRSEAGKKGAVHGHKGGRPRKDEETGKRQKRQNNPPSSSSSSSTSKREDKTPLPPVTGGEVSFPTSLDSEEFKIAWADWLADRRARKIKAMTERGVKEQLQSLEPLGENLAIQCIKASIANGWQGLFPDRFKPKSSLFPVDRAAAQDARIMAQIREATQKA